MLLKPSMTENAPEFCIVMDMPWIEVIPDGPLKEGGILRDDG
jgi:hypothetical protein